MAKKPDKKPDEEKVEPTVLEEPEAEAAEPDQPEWDDSDQNVWMRGLWMILFAMFFAVGEAILALAAVLQFLWLLFGKEKNKPVAAFGEDLADWLARVTRYQTCATEERPFPFDRWGKK